MLRDILASRSQRRKRPARASQYDLESRTALFTFAMLVRLLASLLLVSLGRTALADGSSSVARADSYRETLRLTPFPDGKVHSEFSFRLEGAWRDEGLAVSQNAVGTYTHWQSSPRSLTNSSPSRSPRPHSPSPPAHLSRPTTPRRFLPFDSIFGSMAADMAAAPASRSARIRHRVDGMARAARGGDQRGRAGTMGGVHERGQRVVLCGRSGGRRQDEHEQPDLDCVI